jgi:DNA repair exonuclease SbcCD nuclease subunit
MGGLNKRRRHLAVHLAIQRDAAVKKRKSSLVERTIGEIRRFDGKKWIHTALLSDSTCSIKLHLRGEIKVYLNMIRRTDQIKVEKELLRRPKLFREHSIQDGREPPANLFFHENATCYYGAEAAQPGYKYESTRMMAISYKGFPGLRSVSKKMAELCSVPNWNVG